MKRLLAIVVASTTLALGATTAHAQTADDITTWEQAVAADQARAWEIAVWNQAVVNAEVGQVSWDCNVMLVTTLAQGADRHELRHWLYIGNRESHCLLWALADRPSTGDYSVCWYQINFYRGLRAARTAAFGPPDLLRVSGPACANAALALRRGGWGAWS